MPFQGDILIIEDESGVRQVLARHLEEEGYRVRVAADLPRGLMLLRQEPFDLVLCDIRLPGRSGLEILNERSDFVGDPLVILMTGYPSLESAQQALRHGAFDYLVKPVLAEALLRATSLALNTKALRDEERRLHHHLEAVFESVEDGLITVDPQLRIVACNQLAVRLCGIDGRDVGRSLNELENGCSGVCRRLAGEALEQGRKVTGKRLPCSGAGRAGRVVSVTATPMQGSSQQRLGVVLAVHDETPLVDLEARLAEHQRFHRLVGESSTMRAIYRLVENLADLETTVLICGESGTGKELVAEAIHNQGQRRNHPMVKVNCVALSETLLESELFGHVRGAFTGAVKDRVGRFQEADGGTLFLDEIGDISMAMQLRLLRVLQHKQIERVGENRSITVDVRIIAATHQDLRVKVAEGRFREDLYYRLKVVEIDLPPLRSRGADIPLLIEHFVAHFNRRFGRAIQGFSPAATILLLDYAWPGNIRELEHAIEHAFVVCRGEWIEPEHLPNELRDPLRAAPVIPPGAMAKRSREGESTVILAALSACNWRRDQAARRLGISRATLFRKMRQLGLMERPEF
ncbi:MAG: sigma 54-interacting transcriptional regulator [Magnetococcus sp. YQC-9]